MLKTRKCLRFTLLANTKEECNKLTDTGQFGQKQKP